MPREAEENRKKGGFRFSLDERMAFALFHSISLFPKMLNRFGRLRLISGFSPFWRGKRNCRTLDKGWGICYINIIIAIMSDEGEKVPSNSEPGLV